MRGTDLACIPPARISTHASYISRQGGKCPGGQQRAALRDRAGAAMTHIGLRAHAAGCPDPPCIAADLCALGCGASCADGNKGELHRGCSPDESKGGNNCEETSLRRSPVAPVLRRLHPPCRLLPHTAPPSGKILGGDSLATDQTLIFHFFEFAVKLESPFLSPNAAPSTVDFSIESRQPSLASHSLVVPVDAAACRSALTRVKRRAQAVMLIYSSLDYAGPGRGPLLAGIKGWRRRRRRKVCSKLTQ
jgi:hypothetical protein